MSGKDKQGPEALRLKNNEQKWHYKGSVSKPLDPKRFNISKKGLTSGIRSQHDK
jgi:hypothetical protein